MTLQYSQILVAIDGSEESEMAFKKSIAIALQNNAALNLVNIVDTRSYSAVETYDRENAELANKFAVDLLNEYKVEAEAAGISKVSVMVEYGSPKTMISRDIAKKLQIDLIICGATGLNTVERFFIGSVSESIVRTAKCDVLVIRTPEV
ncbi:universal stress protein [Sporosarcina siberiensis]|uniref:Universal stress protein n=1 Tax=Sporosarcina siberiensis TaxID=1365606 RepID=A0ABW4SFI3_9BACL